MEDQQLYKANNHAVNNNESLYYQPQQTNSLSTVSGGLNHSYSSSAMNVSQLSPVSPHYSQDSRDNLTIASKNLGATEPSRQTGWTHPGSGNSLNSQNNQNLMWNNPRQDETTDGYYYPYSSQANENQSQAVSSGVLHKLDSFTQAFTNQNLKTEANSMTQGLHTQSLLMDNASDSALRHLLSQKPAVEQHSLPSSIQRYQPISQSGHPSFASPQQKQHLQAMQQQQQQHLYYDYSQHIPQMQSQPPLPHGQQHMQQMQLPQMLPQQIQYYMQQQQQPGQQPISMQEMQHQQTRQQQQQTQCSLQISQYYQTHTVMQQLHQVVQQQQHHMQLQPPAYQRDYNQKTMHERHQYSQEHPVQLMQLGAVPQYFYQNPQQQYSQLYGQSLLQQQQPQQEVSQQKQYQNESRTQGLLGSYTDISNTEVIENHSRQDMGTRESTVPHQPVGSQPAIHPVNNKGLQQSSNAMWSQQVPLPESRLQAVSPEQRNLQKETFPDRSDAKSRLTCSVCFKEFKSLPALNGHMRSHGGMRASPHFKQEIVRKPLQSGAKSETSEENLKPLQEKRKYRHRPEPLFIPPPSFNFTASYSGATLYQSQLRSPRIMGDHLLIRMQELPPYTPPPMLSPVRHGSGLFSSVIASHCSGHPQLPLTPLTPTPRILLCRPNNIDGSSVPVTPGPGEQTIDIEPRINIGSRFQAEIPKLRKSLSRKKDVHKATLLWKPCPGLEDKDFQQRVESLLNMSCSSVLPGGGTNLEYALHSLFEANGNIMVALEILLLRKQIKLKCHPLTNYHYAGSDKWTSQEKKVFNKALVCHNKDFFHVQKMIKTKTVAQCVEYYYTWKKIVHLGWKHRARITEIDGGMTSGEEEDLEDDEPDDDRKSEKEEETETPKSPVPPATVPMDQLPADSHVPATASVSFTCEMPNCGAVFNSRQALNGHARIHGGTNSATKTSSVISTAKQKPGAQSDYSSVKSSPAHSTTSGETDPTTVFPCKECGKIFFKIKSRNAHMKTHRQQEELQRQKAEKAAAAAEMASAIARTTVPVGHGLIPMDHLSLIKQMEQIENDFSDVQDLDVLLDEDDTDLLQADSEL
ncbi:transcriptional-regulating factor 1 isoform X4 [Rhinatrema bivittatum]|uniref:transcriptional-regulating factor 1 isoform X4 n=1 Tax=Rhinatrema bivittatum TaxID=194408 RepID=UPI0011296E10|nr:transcriptional-regulating factor 1 isoform X4 [Rhinatrema bivittatum]